jgi:hypothetical protein
MAKFNETISPIAANPFISPGVRDDAIASLVGNAGKIGLAAYEGYQEADLQKKISGITDEYFNPAVTDQELTDMGTEIGALEGAFADRYPEDLAGMKKLEALNKDFENKLSNFAAAKKQGRMSLDELQTRILSATREAINRNPMLESQLMGITNKYMELSGLGSFIKEQEKLQQSQLEAQNDFLKRLDQEGKDRDIPGWFNMDISQKMAAVDVARRRDYALKELEAQNKVGTYVTKQQAQSWISEKGNDALNGHLDQVNVAVQSIFKNKETNNWAQVKYQVGDIIAGAKRDFDSKIPQHLLNDPDIKEYRDRYYKNLDEMIVRMNGLGSGEDAATAWKNEVTKTQSIQEWNLRQEVDLERANLGIRLIQAYPNGLLDGDNLKKAKSFLSSIMSNMWVSPNAQAGLPKEGTALPSPSTVAIQSAVKLGEEKKDWGTLSQVLDMYNKGYTQIQDPKQRALFVEQNLKALAQGDLSGLDAAGVGKVKQMIGSYFNDPQIGLKSLENNILKYPGTMMDVMDDGRILFAGPEADAFNAAFGNKINTALEVYAKANGQSIKEAAPRFYDEYRKNFVDTEETPQEQPKKTTTPEELAIQSGEIPSLTQEQKDFFYNKKPIDSKKGVETLQAYKLRSSLGLPPPKDVIPFDQTEQYKIIEKAKADAIEPVGFLEHLIGMGVGAKVAKDVAGWAFKTMMEVPEIPAAGRIAFGRMASNVTPLNGGASKAVVQAYKAGKKAQLDAAFKEYFKTGWTKSRVKWPSSDAEWPKFIDDAWEWAAKQVK